MKPQKIVNRILRKKNKARGIMLPDFKLYYKSIVIKTVYYLHKIDTWKRIKSPQINSCTSVQLIFDKGFKNI